MGHSSVRHAIARELKTAGAGFGRANGPETGSPFFQGWVAGVCCFLLMFFARLPFLGRFKGKPKGTPK